MRRLLFHGWDRRRLRPVLDLATDLDLVEVDWSLRRQRAGALGRCRRQLASGHGARAVITETWGLDVLPLLWLARHDQLPLALRLRGNPWREAVDGLALLPPGLRLRRRLNWSIAKRALAGASHLWPIAANLDVAAAQRHPTTPRSLVENLIHGLDAANAAPVGPCVDRLVTVTNFSFWQKIEPLLEVAPIVLEWCRRRDIEWWLVGDGWFLDRCKQRIGPAPALRWCGHRPVAEIYASRPILLYPTGLDALPGAVVEAAAWRLPIVVDRLSAAGDLLDDAQAHRLDFGDHVALTASLDQLLDDPAGRDALGQRAGEWVRERFSPRVLSAQIEAAISTLLDDQATG